MQKKIFVSILLILVTLIGCSKIVSEEMVQIQTTVEEVEYFESYTSTTCILNGKIVIPVSTTYPESYVTILSHEGVTYKLEGEQYYNYYKDKIGHIVNCSAIKYSFSDGTYSYKLKAILS